MVRLQLASRLRLVLASRNLSWLLPWLLNERKEIRIKMRKMARYLGVEGASLAELFVRWNNFVIAAEQALVRTRDPFLLQLRFGGQSWLSLESTCRHPLIDKLCRTESAFSSPTPLCPDREKSTADCPIMSARFDHLCA